jgi:SHS2 domain-containing protein
MEKFTYLSHTADIKIRVFGETLEQIFQNSLEAITNYLSPIKTEPLKTVEKSIQIISLDQLTLLVDFLNEVISQNQIQKAVFEKAKIEKLETEKAGRAFLKSVLEGYKIESFQKDIKAVTYHQGKIEPTAQGYVAEFVLDI